MESFDIAAQWILKIEGGYVNNPLDPGGETKYGITKRSYPHLDIKNLTPEQATEIYRTDFWLKYQCDKMPFATGIVFFDLLVNSGPNTAIRLLQIVVDVTRDEIMGPETLSAIIPHTFFDLNTLRILFLIKLSNFPVFGTGWINRVIKLTYLIGNLNERTN